MVQQAYICLTDDHYWAVASHDDVNEEITLLAIGRPFTEGADMREAVAELEAWAEDSGYQLTTPGYTLCNWSLRDLIEPEIFKEVFGTADW